MEAQLLVSENPTGLGLECAGKNVSLKLNLILVLESRNSLGKLHLESLFWGKRQKKKLRLRIKNYLEEEKNRQSVVKKSL